MQIEIKRKNKKSIFGDLKFNESSKNLLIMIHGFKGFYKWGFFPEIQKRFLAHNCAVLSFNFSMNGVFRHGDEITDFNSFSENNFTLEQDDFTNVISFVKSKNFPVKFSNVYGLGHSRGGGALLLAATNHPNFFKKVVTLASISRIHHRLPDAELMKLKTKGFAEYVNGRTGDILRVNYQFQKNLEDNYDAFDIVDRIKTLTADLLVVHGDKDETVPVSDAYELIENVNKSNYNKLVIIKSATHTFNYDKLKNRLPWQLNEAIIRSLYFLDLMTSGRVS